MKGLFPLALLLLFFLPLCYSVAIPPPAFFIGEDGTPDVLLVIGENAAAEDIVSASLIAAKIGQLAVRAEEETFRKFEKVKKSSYAFMPSSIVPNSYLDTAATYALSPLYFPPSPILDPLRYNQIVLTPATLKTLFFFDENFVDYHGNDDGLFQYFETHEEIILRFYDAISFHKWSGMWIQDNIVDLYGGDFLGEYTAPPPPPSRVYPSITYRVAPIYLPRYLVASSQSLGADGTSPGYYAIPEPQLFSRGLMPKIYFFDKIHYVIDAGMADKMVIKGGEYMDAFRKNVRSNYLVYGVPYFYLEEYIGMGETHYFNNFAIRLDDVDLDHNKAIITVTEPSLFTHTFRMVLNPQHGFSPSLQKEGPTGIPRKEMWTGEYLDDVVALTNSDIIQEDEQYYTIVGVDELGNPKMTGENNIIVYFLLDGIAAFHGDTYNGLLFNLYILDDFGRYYDMRCCFPYIDTPQKYALDIFPAGRITFPDTTFYDVWGMDVDLCEDMLNTCPDPFFLQGPLDYFKISFEDTEFIERDGDDLSFWVEKSLPIQTVYITVPARFSAETLIRLDSEVTESDMRSKNLILLGGPVSNSISLLLVRNKKSRIDWYHSDGEWEYIQDPFGAGHDVLIVAGRDRSATRITALELVRRLGTE